MLTPAKRGRLSDLSAPTLAHSVYVLEQLLHVMLHTVGQQLSCMTWALEAAQNVRLPPQWPCGCLYSGYIQRRSLAYATARYGRVISGVLLRVVSLCSLYILFLCGLVADGILRKHSCKYKSILTDTFPKHVRSSPICIFFFWGGGDSGMTGASKNIFSSFFAHMQYIHTPPPPIPAPKQSFFSNSPGWMIVAPQSCST